MVRPFSFLLPFWVPVFVSLFDFLDRSFFFRFVFRIAFFDLFICLFSAPTLYKHESSERRYSTFFSRDTTAHWHLWPGGTCSVRVALVARWHYDTSYRKAPFANLRFLSFRYITTFVLWYLSCWLFSIIFFCPLCVLCVFFFPSSLSPFVVDPVHSERVWRARDPRHSSDLFQVLWSPGP